VQTFFHVTATDHQIGTELQPGRFGTVVRSSMVKQTSVDVHTMNTLAWESALEVARRCVALSAPSRLSCLFATPTHDEAKQFQQRYRVGSYIFAVGVADTTPIYLADFESITTTMAGKPFLDTFVDAAISYWKNTAENTLREALVGGPATVLAKIS
jgi:hypothetical protein